MIKHKDLLKKHYEEISDNKLNYHGSGYHSGFGWDYD